MAIQSIGIVGWRGMVGSVLLERMQAEQDLQGLEVKLFSTSQAGELGPDLGNGRTPLCDAHSPDAFHGLDVVISCQGGDYTQAMHTKLRARGFKGYWIDAASTLRMADNAVIILDPVNRRQIDTALERGVRDFVGGNCTVSLMLMATHALFDQGWVEWVNASTYQAASGAGAKNLVELVRQMDAIGQQARGLLEAQAVDVLALDRQVSQTLRGETLPTSEFGAPLAASLIPWIDRAVDGGQTREEWKGQAETNKILGTNPAVPVDGVCVRVGAMRCHSQALTLKLKQDVPLDEVSELIGKSNEWVRLVPNEREATLQQLSPAAVSGTLNVPVGRLRKLKLGPEYLSLFTVGDQLLWGAAEPLRRMLCILRQR